jgi:hypothetical protein
LTQQFAALRKPEVRGGKFARRPRKARLYVQYTLRFFLGRIEFSARAEPVLIMSTDPNVRGWEGRLVNFMIVLAAVSALGVSTPDTPYQHDLKELTRNMPVEIHDFIDRRANCNHWAGEEAFDDARAAEIRAAVSRLRCMGVDDDEAALKRRYAHSPEVIKALDKSKNWTPG